jgi:dTDP-4-dehydrorhamnose reductase
MKKILVIGGSGYIGRNFGFTISNNHFLKTQCNNNTPNCVFFDLSNSKLDDIDINFNEYSHVIVAAGMVQFNQIRSNPAKARHINIDCTKKLIDDIIKKELTPVFISSESVFDGQEGNYSENHKPNPIFEYGRHKFEIEQYIKSLTEDYLIIRLSKVFDSQLSGETLIVDWLTKIEKNEDIFCADDHIFTPIHLEDVIIYIEKLIKMDATGLFHVSSTTPFARDAMLESVIKSYNSHKDYKGSIIKQSLHLFKGASEIPLNTSMNPSKIINKTGLSPKSFLLWIDVITTKFINNMESSND